ncbi:hypothetical protein AW14_02400 [Siansivirga zeaxanthinifaciens CC-SAMT-1]|uniref:DUF4301 domain-containing protein n=1 Tax=Siansivirga zeaxanthinifaciens CC-SAMT-1 TaxID=1454006 RepID=A0A0C5W8S9_9FLAO|nr:hypothetical protein AW14_02400 [Siansivirga zeaxanthinifaciens CC-SAMT-1]
MVFTDKDLNQIKNHGLTLEKVNAQIELIKSGMTYSKLKSAATTGNGILKFDKDQQQNYIDFFEAHRNQLEIVKFVPASGAATRMFKFLFQFLKEYNVNADFDTYLDKNMEMAVFVKGLKAFPFYEKLESKLIEQIPDYKKLPLNEQCLHLVKTMLNATALNYSFYPKGLLPFHKYDTEVSTAFQEHLLEATLYASSNNKAHLHFTVSEAHQSLFVEELNKIKATLESQTNTTFNVSFSFQSKSTDAITITSNDALYRNDDGSLLFRPSGHGALIENLNALNYDLIFIKNIDNIVVFEQNKQVSKYKKMLAGILLKIQNQAFKYLHRLDDEDILEDEIHNIELFVINRMNVHRKKGFKKLPLQEKVAYLKDKLNRPIRVCGMVKNEGEPGGGPFWIKEEDGKISLEIIEFPQINIDKKSQRKIVAEATHFNPTDLVCGVRDYKGNKFDLTKYVDHKAAFITMKSQNGTDIKALELPGLWNGSMAYWNSIFVEIPLETFNPVKTVNDLLKPAHQA